ncbi:hypothetical protein QQX98_004138 [Neonectria punicea]|uniref:Uncharacterized protein n=1 Tax=Neonectria punicea TaxID=979145 RepID=A0ABR1HAI9_9HYPO
MSLTFADPSAPPALWADEALEAILCSTGPSLKRTQRQACRSCGQQAQFHHRRRVRSQVEEPATPESGAPLPVDGHYPSDMTIPDSAADVRHYPSDVTIPDSEDEGWMVELD